MEIKTLCSVHLQTERGDKCWDDNVQTAIRRRSSHNDDVESQVWAEMKTRRRQGEKLALWVSWQSAVIQSKFGQPGTCELHRLACHLRKMHTSQNLIKRVPPECIRIFWVYHFHYFTVNCETLDFSLVRLPVNLFHTTNLGKNLLESQSPTSPI